MYPVAYGRLMHCAVTWDQVSTRSLPAFDSYSATGQALIASARNEYRPVEVEYGELIAFNDRYTKSNLGESVCCISPSFQR